MAVKLNTKKNVLKNGYHRMTLDFGNTYSDGSFHKGIDLTGNPEIEGGYDYILALEDGVVTSVKNNFSGTTKNTGTAGMGNYVIIDHGNGYKTRYMHMTKGSVKVKKGQQVKAGDIIGYMGSTGNSTGRHLHFDISFEGKYIDPKRFLCGTDCINPEKSEDDEYKTGSYIVVSDVNVRKGPGTNYDRVYFSQFTLNARNQVKKIDKSCPSHFPAGVKLTISKVEGTWGKCPSGWVSLKLCRARKG